MNSNPLVSILTPCYNARNFIKDVIDSVFQQTYQNFEHILVDDGSKDPIKDIVDSYNSDKLKYYYTENGGPTRALNFATEHANGEYVAFLNHDDIWKPEKLEEQLAELEKRDAIWIASGCHRINLFTDIVLERFEGEDYFKNVFYDILEKKYLWSFSSVMIRKDVFINAGMFTHDIWTMPDRLLYLKIAKIYPLAYLAKVHVIDRFHSSNITAKASLEIMLDDHAKLIKNAHTLDSHIPQKVIENSERMINQTACIEYMRANDLTGMRKMLRLLKFDIHNLKFIPYRILSIFDDKTILTTMSNFRKFRRKINPSKIYPDIEK